MAGGDICHITTDHTVCSRSKASGPRDDELGVSEGLPAENS